MKLTNFKLMVDTKYPPLTWNIIALKFFPDFRNRKINILQIDSNTDLPYDIQRNIENFLHEKYSKIKI